MVKSFLVKVLDHLFESFGDFLMGGIDSFQILFINYESINKKVSSQCCEETNLLSTFLT